MKIIDISWPISQDSTEYKDKRDSVIKLNVHAGTHIDAPAHFIKNGKTIDKVDLNKVCGSCQVLDLTDVEEKITQKDLKKFNIKPNEIILLKTKNSNLAETGLFYPDFVYLEKTGAGYLADKKVKAVGIDYLGIEKNQPNHETHKILMKQDIPIIEGLRLKNIQAKNYFFYCLPLLLKNLEAAPARAILLNT